MSHLMTFARMANEGGIEYVLSKFELAAFHGVENIGFLIEVVATDLVLEFARSEFGSIACD